MTIEFQHKMKILEQHLDSFGHVNNAVYLQLFEQARWKFITERGFGLNYIKKIDLGPVLLELNLTFKKELKNRDTIIITSRSTGMKNRLIMTMEQIMKREDGQIASRLNFTMGLMDLKKRKLIRPTNEWLGAIGFTDDINIHQSQST